MVCTCYSAAGNYIKPDANASLSHLAHSSNPSLFISIGLIPQSVPILFLANKSDHAQSASTDVIVDRLRIQDYCKLHKWHVAATDGLRGTGVNDAVEWLTSAMPVKKKKK